jgi:hypothetical protein
MRPRLGHVRAGNIVSVGDQRDTGKLKGVLGSSKPASSNPSSSCWACA